jgi:DNA-binding NtrC family response regulator
MIIPRVLLVDDEAPFVETMVKRLKKRELEVYQSLSAEKALDILEANPGIDAVILDVKMPGMDGIEALKRIKAAFPLIEVIMLTGHATVESAIEGMKLGAFDYLMKPCEIDQLIEKVNQAAVKKRGHEAKIDEARVINALTRHGM